MTFRFLDRVARQRAHRNTERSVAQEASPELAGPALGDPHPSADTATHDPEFLFVQPFTSGTWSPKEGSAGIYTLSLTGASANTVYFSDRPERVFGTVTTSSFLDGLGFTPTDPPNAALVAQHPDGDEQEVLVVELLNPAYDGDTLTYDARVLADYGEPGLAHTARQQQGYTLPESFAAGSLFIDDCPTYLWECVGDTTGMPYGHATVKYCPNLLGGFQCEPCRDPALACMEQIPQSCRKETIVDGVTTYGPVCVGEF